MKSKQQGFFETRISKLDPNAYRNLENIAGLAPEVAALILKEILGFACDAQHIGSITAGRQAFARLNSRWLEDHLSQGISSTLDLSDEWQYRRLLELLKSSNNSYLVKVIYDGMQSSQPNIREIAVEFKSKYKL